MRRRLYHRHTLLTLAALVAFLPVVSGCDSAGADESDFQFLTGAWRIEAFRIDGSSFEAQLEAQYENGVVFVFSKGDGGFRQFQLSAYPEGGEPRIIDGRVDIDGEENNFFLVADAYPRGVLFSYEIQASNRVRLTASGPDAEVFVETLLDLDISRESRLSLTIVQTEPPQGT